MSSTPTRDAQAPSTQSPQLQTDSDDVELRKPFSVVSAATGAAATVAARTVGFGGVGFLVGTGVFFIERATGLLSHPADAWRYLVYVLLLAYMAAGAFCLGTAGMWRGIGRAAMNLVKEHKLVQHIMNRVLDRAAALAEGSATPEVLRKPLPIQKVRELLARAIAAYAGSDDTEKGVRGMSRAILRRLKMWVCRTMESKLNDIIGQQQRDQGVVELTLNRLRELAETHLEVRVLDALDGARNKQALVFTGIFVAILVLPPVVLRLLH